MYTSKLCQTKSSLKLGILPKLAARFRGPFQILDRIRHVAYPLAMLASLYVHNVFHVSLLNKYVLDLNYIIDCNLI